MNPFESTLLRERFKIKDLSAGTKAPPNKQNTDAASNRMALRLDDTLFKDATTPNSKNHVSNIIIRSKNMHGCARMASRILHGYEQGKILSENTDFDWQDAWHYTVSDFERKHNPENWCAVYLNGNVVFSHGEYHRFLDTIERANADHDYNYEKAFSVAQDGFRDGNNNIYIEYVSTYALIINYMSDIVKSGIILRGDKRTMTFNFSAQREDAAVIQDAHICLSAAAAFLESVQFDFLITRGQQVLKSKTLSDKKMIKALNTKITEASTRLNDLSKEIDAFENTFKVRYRPERPHFKNLITSEIRG